MFKSGDRAAPAIRLCIGDISAQAAVEVVWHWCAGGCWLASKGK
jgi:hypothetical protein